MDRLTVGSKFFLGVEICFAAATDDFFRQIMLKLEMVGNPNPIHEPFATRFATVLKAAPVSVSPQSCSGIVENLVANITLRSAF